MNKNEILQKSNAKKIIACFGKSTVESASPEYQICVDVGNTLVSGGYAVIHGGYAGGSMEAVSFGAQQVIANNNLSPLRDLGVAMSEFDKDWKRTEHTSFIKTCDDLSDRVGTLINMADAYVILPKGGLGTMLEFVHALHQNELKQYTNSPTKQIYVMDKKWERLLNAMFEELDVSPNVVSIKYVATANELSELLNK